MNIIENATLECSGITNPYMEYRDKKYHIYFFYNIEGEVGGVSDLTITYSGTTNVHNVACVTAEYCTNRVMTDLGNIYAIHVVLYGIWGSQANTTTATTEIVGTWDSKNSDKKIPFSITINHEGCNFSIDDTDMQAL